MKIKPCYLISLAVLVSMAAFGADTNSVAPVIPAATSIQVTDATSALSALLHYLGISDSNLVLGGVVLHIASKYIRNYFFANKSSGEVGVVGKVVSFLAASPLSPTPEKSKQAALPAN